MSEERNNSKNEDNNENSEENQNSEELYPEKSKKDDEFDINEWEEVSFDKIETNSNYNLNEGDSESESIEDIEIERMEEEILDNGDINTNSEKKFEKLNIQNDKQIKDSKEKPFANLGVNVTEKLQQISQDTVELTKEGLKILGKSARKGFNLIKGKIDEKIKDWEEQRSKESELERAFIPSFDDLEDIENDFDENFELDFELDEEIEDEIENEIDDIRPKSQIEQNFPNNHDIMPILENKEEKGTEKIRESKIQNHKNPIKSNIKPLSIIDLNANIKIKKEKLEQEELKEKSKISKRSRSEKSALEFLMQVEERLDGGNNSEIKFDLAQNALEKIEDISKLQEQKELKKAKYSYWRNQLFELYLQYVNIRKGKKVAFKKLLKIIIERILNRLHDLSELEEDRIQLIALIEIFNNQL